MRSRLDKNNSNKSHKKIIIISIVVVLFAVMLMITVVSLSIAGKSSIEAESAKQNRRSKKVSSSSQASSEKSVSTIASTSSSISSSSESINSNSVNGEERSMYFTRMSIGLAVGKAIPKVDYFEEISEGFKIYFVDGMSYNVRDTIYSENLDSEYNFGNNHGFEIYFDHAPAVRLKVPQGLGGVYDITPDMLKQYAIR